jgi:hypothetical protein
MSQESDEEDHITQYLIDYTDTPGMAMLSAKKKDLEEEKSLPEEVKEKDRQVSTDEVAGTTASSDKPIEPN